MSAHNPNHLQAILNALRIVVGASLLCPPALAVEPRPAAPHISPPTPLIALGAVEAQPPAYQTPEYIRLIFSAAAGQSASAAEFRALEAKISEKFEAASLCTDHQCQWRYSPSKYSAAHQLSLVQGKDEILLSFNKSSEMPSAAARPQELLSAYTITALANGQAVRVRSYYEP